ncbi:MAG: hypothetical protein ACK4ND_05020 [Cytophagaceae bacterium]
MGVKFEGVITRIVKASNIVVQYIMLGLIVFFSIFRTSGPCLTGGYESGFNATIDYIRSSHSH